MYYLRAVAYCYVYTAFIHEIIFKHLYVCKFIDSILFCSPDIQYRFCYFFDISSWSMLYIILFRFVVLVPVWLNTINFIDCINQIVF